MATAQTQEEILKCPICFERLINPCKLPGCLHKFCENCLLTYISNLKLKDEIGLESACPVCRIPIALPTDDADFQH